MKLSMEYQWLSLELSFISLESSCKMFLNDFHKKFQRNLAKYPVKIYATWPCNSRFLLIQALLAFCKGFLLNGSLRLCEDDFCYAFPSASMTAFPRATTADILSKIVWDNNKSHKLFSFLKWYKLHFNSLGEDRISVIIPQKISKLYYWENCQENCNNLC